MSSMEEILSRLLKLKQQASEAHDLPSLEKVAEKVQKIKPKLFQLSSNQQLAKIINKIQLLIRGKGKNLKQKMITSASKISKGNKQQQDIVNRTIKHSKSAQSLKMVPHIRSNGSIKSKTNNPLSKTIYEMRNELQKSKNFQRKSIPSKVRKDRGAYLNRQLNKNAANCSEDQSEYRQKSSFAESQSQFHKKQQLRQDQIKDRSLKSENGKRNGGDQSSQSKTAYNKKHKSSMIAENEKLQNQVNFLQEKLAFSITQIENLTKKVSALQKFSFTSLRTPMAKQYDMKQQEIVNYYKQQVNSKNFLINSLQSKLCYFKSMNEQLKNRVFNEQRRNEDYIQELKREIKNLKKTIEKYKKENEKLNTEIEDLFDKNGGLINEVGKLLHKLEEQTAQKQKTKKSIISSAALKAQELQRQICHLSTQTAYISTLQLKLQHEQEQNEGYKKQKSKLETRIAELQQQSKKYRQERDKIEEEFFKMHEQPNNLRNELKVNKVAKDMLVEELLDTKEKLQNQLRMSTQLQYENDLKTKSKLSKLRQIKGLLTQLR